MKRRKLLGRLGARRPAAAAPGLEAASVITIRIAAARRDDVALERLAELAGEVAPAGPTLVAEVDGEARAALPLAGGSLLSDPFHPSRELGSLLSLRVAQLGAAGERGLPPAA